jgi:hypothetical protein
LCGRRSHTDNSTSSSFPVSGLVSGLRDTRAPIGAKVRISRGAFGIKPVQGNQLRNLDPSLIINCKLLAEILNELTSNDQPRDLDPERLLGLESAAEILDALSSSPILGRKEATLSDS